MPAFALGAAFAQEVPKAEPPRGTVVFSHPSVPGQQAAPEGLAEQVTDAMRATPVFTDYALTVHLQPATAELEAEARITVRNGGSAPLVLLPLQLSSGLTFNRVRAEGKPLRFAAHRVDSDADHTGALTEAAVELAEPLAPGASLLLTVEYGGEVRADSGRLARAQASAGLARRSDWDQVSEGFTALRGFGNTVWYPAASVPALLGEGLARETARQRAVNAGATVRMAVTVEFTGHAPNVLVADGTPLPAAEPVSLPTATFPGVFRFALPPAKLGAQALSLVVAARDVAEGSGLVTTASLAEHAGAAEAYAAGASLLEPLFRDWFGGLPASPLLMVDVPAAEALPFEMDGVLLLGFVNGVQPSQLAPGLIGPLTHAYFRSPRPWLREGAAGLMQVLWTERTEGRAKALEQMGVGRGALAFREPATPGAGGEPLIAATDPVYARTKATYVLWMLRGLMGEDVLRAALRKYRAEEDTVPGYFEGLLAQAVPRTGDTPPAADTTGFVTDAHPLGLGSASVSQTPVGDLHAFFENWVYGDPGLPELAIKSVAPSHSGSGGQWLVAVEVENMGYAEAWVPLTVRSAQTAETVLLPVPARGSVSRRVLLPDEPTEVELNDGSVPEIGAGAHRRLLVGK